MIMSKGKSTHADASQRSMRFAITFMCLLSWIAWFVRIHRHWAEIEQQGSAIAAVGLLAFLPFPCIYMFVRRETSPASAALMTYLLLGFALGIAFIR
jgi:hypothetical protein